MNLVSALLLNQHRRRACSPVFRLFVAVLIPAALCLAGGTITWSQNSYADFRKGKVQKLSISSDGRLALAPVFKELFDSSSAYLWALAEDSKGNLYAGGGGPSARVYIIPPEGKPKTLAELPGIDVYALAIDKQNRLYAATSPDGRIYRISASGQADVFYEPQAKYIWALAFDSQGNLFAATGDRGEIHRVSPEGKGDVFYRSADAHARSLVVDSKDNVILGTEPGGLIVRITPKGESFVLYQAPKREITALAVGNDGSIYAAGVGNKQPQTVASKPAPAPVPVTPAPAPQVTPQAVPAPRPAQPAAIPATVGGSEVYRIDSEGFPRRIWSDLQLIVYTIALDSKNRPMIGTGNRGTIFRLDSDRSYTELLSAAPAQVTRLYAGRQGRMLAATGNIGQIYQIGPGLEKEGTLESDVLDAGMFSYWGRLRFRSRSNGGQISLSTRSGNVERPQEDWSPWSPAIVAENGAPVVSPSARFLQWKATLKAGNGDTSPEVHAVDIAYMTKNVAPVVEQIEITPANFRFPQTNPALTPARTLALPPIGRPRPASGAMGGSTGANLQYAKGYIGARWSASDQNGDKLIYKVEIRGEQETEWKLLKDQVEEQHINLDSTAFSDGEYRLRITGSDLPGNTPSTALTGAITSDPFIIDNTAPEIRNLTAIFSKGKLSVRWKAIDTQSIISLAEYSVNGSKWLTAEPVTRLSDSSEEDYELTIEKPEGREHTIAIRISDEYENQSVASVTVRQ